MTNPIGPSIDARTKAITLHMAADLPFPIRHVAGGVEVDISDADIVFAVEGYDESGNKGIVFTYVPVANPNNSKGRFCLLTAEHSALCGEGFVGTYEMVLTDTLGVRTVLMEGKIKTEGFAIP